MSPIPITQRQFTAAETLYEHLPQWNIADRALRSLSQNISGFTTEATLLKVAAVNAIYGTNIYDINGMAHHVEGIMTGIDINALDHNLVNRLAARQNSERIHTSFASKFAHFFVDPNRFPIYDKYAKKALLYHLGRCRRIQGNTEYDTFVARINRLQSLSGIQTNYRQLDHYLWLAGQYIVWRANPHIRLISNDCRNLFSNPPPTARTALSRLHP